MEKEKVFARKDKLPIIVYLKSKIPKLEPFSNASDWFKENLLANCIVLMSFLMYCSDWGTDIQQTKSFWDGYKNKSSTFSISTSIEKGFSFENRIGESDYLVAFGISVSVLLLTTIFHFIICFTGIHEPMISFFNGSCCEQNLITQSKWKINAVKFIIAIFLPFFSKLFVTILMPIQLEQFDKNWKKIEELRKNWKKIGERRKNWENIEELRRNSEEELNTIEEENVKKISWKRFNNCSFCKKCNYRDSICYFCGFLNSDSPSSYEYNDACKNIESELLAQDGFNRIAEMIMENTYLPIVQLFIGLPQLLLSATSFKLSVEFLTSASSYTNLGIVLFSVVTSIMSLSFGITSLYFCEEKKSALGNDTATKLLYTVSMICQITCRLVTFSIFGLVFFDKNEYALLWMVLACFSHVFIVFLLRSVLWTIEEPRKIQKAEKDNNLIIFDIIYLVYGSFLSVFVFVKGRRTPDDKGEQEYKVESQNSKLWSRIFFFMIVITEQGLMYWGIYGACYNKKIEFNWMLFMIVMSVVYVLGLCLEITINIFLNPVAEDRKYFKEKKFTFIGTIGIGLFVATLVLIIKYALSLLWTVIPITGVLIVIVVVLKCNTKGQEAKFYNNNEVALLIDIT